MKRVGQATLEYTVVFAVIVGVIIVVVAKALRPHTDRIYEAAGDKIVNASTNLEDKFGAPPGNAVQENAYRNAE